MGFLDRLRGRAKEVAEQHGDQVKDGIDKVAGVADEKTGGKYADKIESGAEKAKDAVDELGEDKA